MQTFLILWLMGAGGLLVGGIAGGWMGARGTGLGVATLVAIAVGVTTGLVMAVYIVHDALASPSPNAPLAMMLVPVPIVCNTLGALASVLVLRPVVAAWHRPR